MWHDLGPDAAPSVPEGRNLAGDVSGGRTRSWAPCHTWEIVFCEYKAGLRLDTGCAVSPRGVSGVGSLA